MTLSDKARRILNDPQRTAQQEEWFNRLRNLFDGIKDPYFDHHVMTIGGQWLYEATREGDPAYTDPESAVLRALEKLAETLDASPLIQDRFAPVSVEFGFYMVHFIDRVFGADVFYKDGQWNTRYLKNDVGALKMPDLRQDPTWALARRAAEVFLEQDLALPLFGLPTLSSALNIAVNLYGEEILVSLSTDPDAAMHDLNIIQSVIEETHRWYIENIPGRKRQCVISGCRTQPYGYGQLCGCTMQLLSGSMYREYIAPLDDRLLSLYPHGGMIHLCGAHTQHIDTFAAMPHLRAVQVNDRAAEDLALYFHGLREDQILYVNPCPGMPVEKILSVTGGRRTVICADIGAPRL